MADHATDEEVAASLLQLREPTPLYCNASASAGGDGGGGDSAERVAIDTLLSRLKGALREPAGFEGYVTSGDVHLSDGEAAACSSVALPCLPA